MYLVITIRFLGDRYHGRTENGREPEWPPSPLRLYQAIVAGAASRWHDSSLRDEELLAFDWFEGLEPPQILAPVVHRGQSLLKYVRENLSDVDPEKRDAKFSRPTLFCGEPKLVYYWSLDPCFADVAKTIARCSGRCHALGWGIDMVIGNGAIEEKEPEFTSGDKWVPMPKETGNVLLRVPRPATEYGSGTLNELRNRYAASLARIAYDGRNPVPPLSAFRVISYKRGSGTLPRPHTVFEFLDGVAFPQKSANAVAAMMRSLACERAKLDSNPFPGAFPGGSASYVAGHVNGEQRTPARFSYMPLPTVGGPYADGMIRRVLIAEPHGGDGLHARWAQSQLCGAALMDNQGNERAVLVDPERRSSWNVINRYVGESRSWTSVTPVILPGFDDCEYAKAVKLCLDAIRQADLSAEGVEELTLRKVPYWRGTVHAAQYRRPQYLKQLPAWHLRLVFREAVPGPLAVGAGRHCGLGVLAASEERQQ
jgi:CRISPR-associated protein Csb2